MSKPVVHFECLTCQWVHRVPDDRVTVVDGIPRATYVMHHECTGVADIVERGTFEAELKSTVPMQRVKLKL